MWFCSVHPASLENTLVKLLMALSAVCAVVCQMSTKHLCCVSGDNATWNIFGTTVIDCMCLYSIILLCNALPNSIGVCAELKKFFHWIMHFQGLENFLKMGIFKKGSQKYWHNMSLSCIVKRSYIWFQQTRPRHWFYKDAMDCISLIDMLL